MAADTRTFLRLMRSYEDTSGPRGAERRATVRLDIKPLRAALGIEMNGRRVTQTSLIINLSATGALVETMQVWPIGTQVTCSFGLHNSGSFVLGATTVRSVAAKAANKYGHMALHFAIRPGTDSRIMRWIFGELARRRSSEE